MFLKAKREYELIKAFKKIFLDDKGYLKPEAKQIIAYLRDEAGGRGELGKAGMPYFYDSTNRFDAGAAAFLLGKRRMFDLIVKYLALDERKVFALTLKDKDDDADIIKSLEV